MLITAADVVNSATDSGQLVPMLEKSEEIIGGVPTSKMSSSMTLPPAPTSVLRVSVYPFGASAGTTVRFGDHSESTGPQIPCAALAQPTRFAPKDVDSGRALWIGPTDALLRQHRHWMTSETVQLRQATLLRQVRESISTTNTSGSLQA